MRKLKQFVSTLSLLDSVLCSNTDDKVNEFILSNNYELISVSSTMSVRSSLSIIVITDVLYDDREYALPVGSNSTVRFN